MPPREIQNLSDLCLGHFVGEHAAHPDTVLVDVQHDRGRLFLVLLKEAHQTVDDKFQGSVVVVQTHELIHGWWLAVGLLPIRHG